MKRLCSVSYEKEASREDNLKMIKNDLWRQYSEKNQSVNQQERYFEYLVHICITPSEKKLIAIRYHKSKYKWNIRRIQCSYFYLMMSISLKNTQF